MLQVLVNVKPESLVSPQRHLVTKPAIELLSSPNALFRQHCVEKDDDKQREMGYDTP